MISEPIFTPEESLLCIEMESHNDFILVEGPFDISVYSHIYEYYCAINKLDANKIVVQGGGKTNIIDWMPTTSATNYIAVLDMDFDNHIYRTAHPNVIELNRYSIENYFFDEDVVSNLLSFLFSSTSTKVREQIEFDTLYADWNSSISSLTPVLYYYQKIYDGSKEKWNNKFLCKHNCYTLCSNMVERFKNELLTEMSVSESDCIEAYTQQNQTVMCPSRYFPGKLLFDSFYRYLKSICNSAKPKSFSTITNSYAFKMQLAPHLHNNDDLFSIVEQAAQYN
ncbi:DUF4435 domain-containing protein [Vibrio scophthalmi]|uniref:DUF4435 domain-containing protein n=1 Tax=Vibrio scophthalmi TaxID=45658 RepID=UPI002FEFC6B2